ncbi:MAG: type effector Hrp-dependent outer protein, partial [Clostridia bacterium]|nr:type effector Hrp-dependent outer protein [Clostridia bacterium]
VGDSIAPGVPVMIPLKNKSMRLVLKSGNFGQKDFFIRAINKTKENING